MMPHIHRSLAGIAAAIILVTGLALPVSAETGETHTTTQTPSKTSAESNDDSNTSALERQEGKLNEARKKACQAHMMAVGKIVGNAATEGQRHLNLFMDIATRIENFATNKKLTVANYDKDVAAINAKKTTAQAAIDAVKNAQQLDCNNANPIGQVNEFKTKVKAMQQALQGVRQAVKTLLQDITAATTASQGGAQ